MLLGHRRDRGLEAPGVELAHVQGLDGAMSGDGRELLRVDVDGHHLGAHRGRDLDAITTHAPGADHHRQGPLAEAGALDRLVGGGHGVGHHRHVGQREARRREARLIDVTEAMSGDDHVGGEATMNVVARHLLLGADVRPAARAGPAGAAGDHRRDDHRRAEVRFGAGPGGHHAPADLVTERERQRMGGADSVVEIPQIGVANAASGDLHHDLTGLRREWIERLLDERGVDGGHQPAMRVRFHVGAARARKAPAKIRGGRPRLIWG